MPNDCSYAPGSVASSDFLIIRDDEIGSVSHRYFPPLCTQGELQYLAPPEKRHSSEELWAIYLSGLEKPLVLRSRVDFEKWLHDNGFEVVG